MGYDIAGIAKIANVQSLSLAEGCEVGYKFVSALLSIDEKQSKARSFQRPDCRRKINQPALARSVNLAQAGRCDGEKHLPQARRVFASRIHTARMAMLPADASY